MVDSTLASDERLPEPAGWTWRRALLVAGVVLALSTATVLRYTVQYLNADTVLQSVMSVQDVQTFFWGQDRFASVVPLVASPIADPTANLFACLLLNAVAFHVLLLLIASTATPLVTGGRHWSAQLSTFAVVAATAHLVLTGFALHVAALEAQPYSLSYACALGAFRLFVPFRPRWRPVAAVVLAAVSVFVNPSIVIPAVALAGVAWVRKRGGRWRHWVAWTAVWTLLLVVELRVAAAVTIEAPRPEQLLPYFSFSVGRAVDGIGASGSSIASQFALAPVLGCLVLAVAAVVRCEPGMRRRLTRAAAPVAAFALVWWVLFTGNAWVAANQYAFRYFFPVTIAVVVALALPLSRLAAVATSGKRSKRMTRPSAVIAAVGIVGCAVGLIGPLRAPSDAVTFARTEATATYAQDLGVVFVSGYFYSMWPIVDSLLDTGRHAAFGVGPKSGGDRARYRAALLDQIAAGRPPQALCVDEDTATCVDYLDYWTQDGWEVANRPCPVPQDSPGLGRSGRCVVLAFGRS